MNTPRILFVCVRNAGKSRMAEAMASHLAKQLGIDITVDSAGTSPGSVSNQESIVSLAAIGIPLPERPPRKLTTATLRDVDRLILIGNEVTLEKFPNISTTVERWVTDEPSIRGISGAERMNLIRDDIYSRVHELLEREIQP